MKIVKNFQLKSVIFTAAKNRCILHGRVFVMGSGRINSCSLQKGHSVIDHQITNL